jgi:type IV secretion system protein VirB9
MKRIICIALMLPLLALAEITPPKGTYDPRVRIIDYNPQNVVKLSTFYGVSTHVQFDESETIKDIAVGDDQAWLVKPRGNHLFIKPQATKADTNITVVTTRRTYQFALVVQPRPPKDSTAWADPNLIFSLAFRYPDDEASSAAASARRDAVQNRLGQMKSALASSSNDGANFDYWVAGSEEISPTAAKDDGRFIFLTFSNNRDMPAVYSVDDSGNEALINTNVIDGNTIVVQRLVKRLILRKGNYVASVLNKSFELDSGRDNVTGTVSPVVERFVKGVK